MRKKKTTSPQCKALMEHLSEYIDGELGANLCAEIDKHLAECEDCRLLVDTAQQTIELYRQHFETIAVDLPPDTESRLWQALSKAGCVKK